ncbi:MAG: hypothetical protein VB100_05310 [Angelakisella sp.]|nr:hypothetical protein [Angelakisella sp.]
MGIFNSIKEKRANEKQRKENERQEKLMSDAYRYIKNENVRCDSDADYEAIKLIADSFAKNVSIDSTSSIWNGDQSGTMDNNAISDVDANMYYFCKAIIHQNFMIMRKIDALSLKLDKIEKDSKLL